MISGVYHSLNSRFLVADHPPEIFLIFFHQKEKDKLKLLQERFDVKMILISIVTSNIKESLVNLKIIKFL